MDNNESKAIKIVNEITREDLSNCWSGGEEEYQAIRTVLKLIEKQNKKIEDLEASLFEAEEFLQDY